MVTQTVRWPYLPMAHPIIDANSAPYNCVPGTDCTAGLNAALVALSNEPRGGTIILRPGPIGQLEYLLGDGGTVDTDGYGARLFNNTTLVFQGGARVRCTSEGKSPLYSNDADNITLINPYVDGDTFNVGGYKAVNTRGINLYNAVGHNGRIAYDFIDCSGVKGGPFRVMGDANITQGNTDTRGVSVMQNTAGRMHDVTLWGIEVSGFNIGFRVLNSLGINFPAPNITARSVYVHDSLGTNKYGVSIESNPANLQGVRTLRTGHGFVGQSVYGSVFRDMMLEDSADRGFLLFDSSDNTFRNVGVNGVNSSNTGGWSYELRTSGGGGPGCLRNQFYACYDRPGQQGGSLVDAVNPESDYNIFRGALVSTTWLNAHSQYIAG